MSTFVFNLRRLRRWLRDEPRCYIERCGRVRKATFTGYDLACKFHQTRSKPPPSLGEEFRQAFLKQTRALRDQATAVAKGP